MQNLDALIAALMYRQGLSDTVKDPEDLALLIDNIVDGKNVDASQLSAADLTAVQDVLKARFNRTTFPVPSYLKHYLERQHVEPARKASFVVAIREESLRLMEGLMAGFECRARTAAAVRSGQNLEMSNRIVLEDLYDFTYEIIRHGSAEVDLILASQKTPAGKVTLRQENRLLQSESLEQGQATFSRLSRGQYDLSFELKYQPSRSVSIEIV
ncbi:MAG: hypothetical protein HS115_09215 [Spirochaetales bacterium]|nr:hypothetical protein [Spirochaetales bacterium]